MPIMVNGRALAVSDWQRELDNVQRTHPDWPEEHVLARVRESVIEWALIRQQAEQFGGPVPAEAVNAAFANLMDQQDGQPEGRRAPGLSDADEQRIKTELEQSLRVTRFLEDLTRHVPPPAEEAVAAFFTDNQAELVEPEKVHAAHIVRRPANAAAAVQALTALSALRRRLLAGEDFLTTAAQAAENRDENPDLGFLAPGDLPPEFETVVFALKDGEISPIFQTGFGYHLATVLERAPPRPRTLDECRVEIRERLHTELKDDSIGRWVDAQKSVARIVLQE